MPTPDSREALTGDAIDAAQSAPPADPEVAAQAIRDAKGVSRDAESSTQPVYRTQGEEVVTGENVHRSKDAIISEFDSPEENTVRAKG